MVGLFGHAEFGPHATDQALHDPVADGVTVADANRGVPELP
jgi:hypothetical protein